MAVHDQRVRSEHAYTNAHTCEHTNAYANTHTCCADANTAY
jgi:hypothetical protein